MLTDRFYGQHSTDSQIAVEAFSQALHSVAAHRPLGDTLIRTLEADPELISAHALAGFGAIMLGRQETFAQAQDARAKAQKVRKARPAISKAEEALLAALDEAAQGRLRQAAEILECHLKDHPEHFLAAKIAHSLRFMLGDRNEMVQLSSDLAKRMPESSAGYGFLLGCHSFGLEESGDYAEAEKTGKHATALEPDDSWGLHAVSHVFEMTGRNEEGRNWLNASRPVWSRCNNFAFHMSWHLALLHLEAREYDKALHLYDEEVRSVQTDDFRDMSNAVSLLWRLEQEGVDVGERWSPLHEIAQNRRTDTTYIFGSLHYLLALLACGDKKSAEELVQALRERKLEGCDQGRVAKYIGLHIAEALIRMPGHCAKTGPCLTEIARRLPAIGGSHAQRDVFIRSLMAVALRSQDYPSFRTIDQLRCELRHADRFHQIITQRLESGKPLPRQQRAFEDHDHSGLIRVF